MATFQMHLKLQQVRFSAHFVNIQVKFITLGGHFAHRDSFTRFYSLSLVRMKQLGDFFFLEHENEESFIWKMTTFFSPFNQI